MTKIDKRQIVQMILNQDLEKKDREEIIDMLVDNPIAIDIEKEEEKNLTFGEKLADKFAENEKDNHFGNGRYVRNLFEKVIEKQANRLAVKPSLVKEDICKILPSDFE